MSSLNIALLILFGVALLAGLGMAIQEHENRKRERKLKLIGLKTAIRRASHLLDNLPQLLVTPELRTMLQQYLISRWDAVLNLEPSQNNQQQKSALLELLQSLPEAAPHPEGQMTIFQTREEATRALAIVKELGQFIADITSRGDISRELGDRLILQAKRSYKRLEVDIDLIMARDVESSQGPEVVIHYYRNCFTKLQRLNEDHFLDRQLFEIRNYLEHLAAQVTDLQETKQRSKEEEDSSKRKFNF